MKKRNLRRLGAAFLAELALATGGWASGAAAPLADGTEPVPGLSGRASHGGAYRAEVVERGGTDGWVVRVSDASGAPVRGATLRAEARFAEREGRATPARVRPLPVEGRYRIEGLRFPAPGWWSVSLRIEAERGTDSLAFNLTVPERSAR